MLAIVRNLPIGLRSVPVGLTELLRTVVDIARTGDVTGHLRAWWEVVTGRVVAE